MGLWWWLREKTSMDMNNRSIILQGLEEPASVGVSTVGGSPPVRVEVGATADGLADVSDEGAEPGSVWLRGAFQPDYPGAWSRGGLNE